MQVLETPKSAEDAFERNSVAAVRALEKQLRASVARDQERLRTLVGGNYRDLLSTAEEIVALDDRTRKVEGSISGLSQQCKPPQLEKGSRPVNSNSSTSAQLRLLLQCITCASKAVQDRSVLLCAKLTVTSRLLLKALSEQKEPPKSVQILRDRATAVRRRLLRLVDTQLTRPSSETDVLVSAICAYSLVTSASSADAVGYFRQVRLEKLRQRVTTNSGGQLQVRESFQYLISSVQSLKSLLGRSVNDMLNLLLKQPILEDHAIKALEALDTDRLQTLIPPDILTFTPYIKRVLLRPEDVQQIATDWVKELCEVYVQELSHVLSMSTSVGHVLNLRKDLLSVILPVYFSINGQDQILSAIRQTTSVRVLELCQLQNETLVQAGRAISSAESGSGPGSSLWESKLAQTLPTSNSSNYVRQVRNSHLGIKGGLARHVKKARSWAEQLTQLRSQFQSIESTRWQDLLEEPDDEDEDTAKAVINQLSRDDPQQFRRAMETSAQEAVSQFHQIMRDATNVIVDDQAGHDVLGKAARVVYLLRALRESSAILAAAVPDLNLEIRDLVSKLYQSLAECVAERVAASFTRTPTHVLSDASLPEDLPTPMTFKLLLGVCKVMSDMGGTDIWSSAAVSSLKKRLQEDVFEKHRYTAYMTTDFDKAFVRAVLRTAGGANEAAGPTDIEPVAKAYWQRTRLLFGALG